MRARSAVLIALIVLIVLIMLIMLIMSIGCTPVDAPDTPQPTSAPPSKAPPSKAPPVTVDPAPEQPAQPLTCLARYELDSHASVLAEQRRRGGAQRWNDFASRYPAASIDPASHHPVERVAGYRVADAPLLWFTPDFADAVVDDAVFGELTVVDATRLSLDQRVTIGTLSERGRAELGRRELLEFLLKSGVIQTFAHIGSTLCLIAEFDDGRVYRAELSGEHEYYTNQANHDPLAFAVDVATSGEIAITGIQPTPIPSKTP
ncbi:MAG: hypothetical protein R6X02_35145 [Enhygromyxa sp.]